MAMTIAPLLPALAHPRWCYCDAAGAMFLVQLRAVVENGGALQFVLQICDVAGALMMVSRCGRISGSDARWFVTSGSRFAAFPICSKVQTAVGAFWL